MVHAIYNEIDPFAAEWLEWLIWAGHIADGVVDRRSIADLRSSDVQGRGQRHFFAGIGVWSYALRLAGWPDDLDIWTGSCPCQPFSSAGRRGGVDDERHLWPTWFELIRECRPSVVVGEQVASPDGRAWLDAVLADLEGAGYACGAANLCAGGVGAPHIRQRLYFVAYADGERLEGVRLQLRQRRPLEDLSQAARRGEAGGLGDAGGTRGGRNAGALPRAQKGGTRERLDAGRVVDVVESPGHDIMGDAGSARPQERPLAEVERGALRAGQPARIEGDAAAPPGATRGFWADADWIPCRDPGDDEAIIYRPVEPGTFPLAYGAPARVGRLRAYGNAIVAQVAATFLEAVMDVIP